MDEWTAFYEFIRANGNARRGLVLVHGGTGLRIYCHGDSVVAVEVSLPRLLFRDNASLITSQTEIDEALHRMERLVHEWAWSNEGPYEFTRIDLVLQNRIPGIPAAPLIQALAAMRHPSCRTQQREWFYNRTINACYHTAGDMTIKAYDKELEVQQRRGVNEDNLRLGGVVRIEIELTGPMLDQALGGGGGIHPANLDFDECYRAYRDILRRFDPVRYQPTEDPKVRDLLLDLLAHAHRQGWTMPDGRPVIDHLRSCRGTSENTRRKYEDVIAGRQLASIGVTWEGLLPEQWPPPHLALSLDQQFGAAVTRRRRRTRESSTED